MEFRPIVRSIGEGRVLKARGSTMWFKALGSETTGMFSLMERELPPAGRRPSPHRHTNCHESFYVLDGEIEFLLDGKSTTGGPGTFVLVPAGVAHTFANVRDSAARVLILHSPAMDRYFEELHALLAEGGDLESERSLMRRHGMELVD